MAIPPAKIARRLLLPGALCAAIAFLPARGPLCSAPRSSDAEGRGAGSLWVQRQDFCFRTETLGAWRANKPAGTRASGIFRFGGCIICGVSPEDVAGTDAAACVPWNEPLPDARDTLIVCSGLPFRWLEACSTRDRALAVWSPWSTSWGVPLGPEFASPAASPLVIPLRVRPFAFLASLAAWAVVVEFVRWLVSHLSRFRRSSPCSCARCRYPVDPVLGCPECGLGRLLPASSA